MNLATLNDLTKLLPPITRNEVVCGMVVPFAFALTAVAIGWRPRRGNGRERTGGPVAIGMAAGWVAAWVLTRSVTRPFPPVDAIQWLAYLGAALLLLAIVEANLRLPANVAAPLALVACAATAWLVSANMRHSTWTAGQTFAWVAGLTLGLFVVWAAVEGLSRRLAGATVAVTLAAAAGVTAIVIDLSGSQTLGNWALALGLMALPAWGAALLAGRASLRGLAIVFVPLWGGVMIAHALYSYSDPSPVPSLLLLAAVPVLLWLGLLPPVVRQPTWRRGLIRSAIVLACLIVAGAMVAVPFVSSIASGAGE